MQSTGDEMNSAIGPLQIAAKSFRTPDSVPPRALVQYDIHRIVCRGTLFPVNVSHDKPVAICRMFSGKRAEDVHRSENRLGERCASPASLSPRAISRRE